MALMQVLIAAALLSGSALAQVATPPVVAAAPVDAATMRTALTTLADRLERDFVVPDAGVAYAKLLRANLAAGRYAGLNAAQFATLVTSDLHAVHFDGHLRLIAPTAATPSQPRARPAYGDPIKRSGWLAPGVAYIAFDAFTGAAATLAKLRAFLAAHASAKTLIIDARNHHGGGLGEMDLIFASIFAKPAELVQMDTRASVEARAGSPFTDGPTLRQIDGPAGVVRRVHVANPGPASGLSTAKVYLLTSKITASAAEHLSLSLKRTRRATLIGETTRGAGNYGGRVDLGGGWQAFVAVGRTFDPDTGKGWDGTGIAPDVAVPADTALDEALRRAGVHLTAAEALAKLS